MNCNAPIGVFDSGVGGLTVAREIMRQLPDERMVYFGDTARLPYGTKSKATVIRYSLQIVRFLKTKGVKAIVVACNTATAQALEEIQAEVDIPVLGVIGAAARVASAVTKNGRIGVVGTTGTIESGMYTKALKSFDPNVQVYGKACPLLVSLVEEASTWQSNYRSFNSTVGEWVVENAPEFMSPATGQELEDNLNKIVGYNNTQAMRAFNADYDNIGWKVDAIKRLQFFLGNEEYRAPEGTSGWYFPSAKELTLMIVGDMEGNINGLYTNDLPVRDILNESFAELRFADEFSPELYWSSSEFDDYNAFVVGFYNGLVAYNTKGAMNCMLRYVLAF